MPGSIDVATSLFDVVAVGEGDEKDVFGAPDVVGAMSVVAGTVCDVPVGSKVLVELAAIVFEVGISLEVVEVWGAGSEDVVGKPVEDCSTEVCRDVLVNEGLLKLATEDPLEMLSVIIAGRAREVRLVEDAPVSVVMEAEVESVGALEELSVDALVASAALEVALADSVTGADVVEVAAEVGSTSVYPDNGCIPAESEEVADTKTAGPRSPVAVFDSEAVLSLVSLRRDLTKLWRRVSDDPVSDEDEDLVESWLEDEAAVVVSFENCRLKCCRAAIRAWARCRCLLGRNPSAFTSRADSSASNTQTESKGKSIRPCENSRKSMFVTLPWLVSKARSRREWSSLPEVKWLGSPTRLRPDEAQQLKGRQFKGCSWNGLIM